MGSIITMRKEDRCLLCHSKVKVGFALVAAHVVCRHQHWLEWLHNLFAIWDVSQLRCSYWHSLYVTTDWALSSCRVLIHYFFHHKLMPLYLNNSSNDCYVTQHKNRIYTFLHFLATRLRTQKAVCAQHCHECRHQPRLDLLACRMPAWVSQLYQQPCISMRAQSVIWLFAMEMLQPVLGPFL